VAGLRLFVALWPTPATRAAAAAKRVPATDLHLTLAFIGAVPQQQRDAVIRAAGIPSARIELRLDRLEVWQGGTVVLRPRSVPAAIVELQARLAASLQAGGVPVDARPFAPHLTLGRKAHGIVRTAQPAVPWRSTGHVLALSAGGRYCVIARCG
jgi:2'-5' RNA ligase